MKQLSQQARYDRVMSQRDLYYFCKEVLGYKDMVPHVHGDLCHFTTNPRYSRFRQACVPRSFFKTWVLTIGKSIWLSLPDEEGLFKEIYPYKGANVRILIASCTVDLASRMINKIKREWESNDRLKAAFPELVPEFNKTRWSDSCAEIKRPGVFTEGTYTAVGVGGSVISQHFDHIIEDDLIFAKKDDFTGMELMPSQEDIDNAIGWHKLVSSLFVDPNTACIDNTGTRWAPHDLIDYIRRCESQYDCFEITATKGAIWPVESNDECVWPERFGAATLGIIRDAQGAAIFETQYLNRPRAGSDITFNIGHIVRHENFDEFPSGLQFRTIVDLASWKDTKKICKNVVLTGAKDDKNNIWIARVDAGKFTPTDVIELIKTHRRQFNSRVLVEEVGYQVALRHFARMDMQTSADGAFFIDALPTDNRKGAKDLRIQSLQPVVANGMFHILGGMKDLVQEIEDYPYGAFKDIIDVCGSLLRYAPRSVVSEAVKANDVWSFDNVIEEFERSKRSEANFLPDPLQHGGFSG